MVKTLNKSKIQSFLHGIIIDECLVWSEHIAQVVKKITRASGIIAKTRYFLNRNTLKLVYYALVYP